MFDNLTDRDVWAYSLGHFFNDLVAACWFNYLIYFLKNIIMLKLAAYALLVG